MPFMGTHVQSLLPFFVPSLPQPLTQAHFSSLTLSSVRQRAAYPPSKAKTPASAPAPAIAQESLTSLGSPIVPHYGTLL